MEDREKESKRCCSDICDTLKLITILQNNAVCNRLSEGCDKPTLGPNKKEDCYNTRPISLYSCCTGSLWRFPYTLDSTNGTSTVFRVEKVDDCCATCRVLAPNTSGDCQAKPYLSTDSFFTIDLKCVSALTCLNDTYVELC